MALNMRAGRYHKQLKLPVISATRMVSEASGHMLDQPRLPEF